MKTPNYLIVHVRSDDSVSVDVEIKVKRGQTFTLSLGNKESDKFRLVMGPDCPRDQRKFILTDNGDMKPAPIGEEW